MYVLFYVTLFLPLDDFLFFSKLGIEEPDAKKTKVSDDDFSFDVPYTPNMHEINVLATQNVCARPKKATGNRSPSNRKNAVHKCVYCKSFFSYGNQNGYLVSRNTRNPFQKGTENYDLFRREWKKLICQSCRQARREYYSQSNVTELFQFRKSDLSLEIPSVETSEHEAEPIANTELVENAATCEELPVSVDMSSEATLDIDLTFVSLQEVENAAECNEFHSSVSPFLKEKEHEKEEETEDDALIDIFRDLRGKLSKLLQLSEQQCKSDLTPILFQHYPSIKYFYEKSAAFFLTGDQSTIRIEDYNQMKKLTELLTQAILKKFETNIDSFFLQKVILDSM